MARAVGIDVALIIALSAVVMTCGLHWSGAALAGTPLALRLVLMGMSTFGAASDAAVGALSGFAIFHLFGFQACVLLEAWTSMRSGVVQGVDAIDTAYAWSVMIGVMGGLVGGWEAQRAPGSG